MPPQVIKRRMSQSQSIPALLRSLKKVKKRKQWLKEAIAAEGDLVKGEECVLHAAKKFGVPQQTRVSGKDCPDHSKW